MYICLSFYISINLSAYLYLSFYMYVWLSIYLYQSICLSIYLSIYLSIRLPVCLCFINITTNHLSLNPSLNPSIAPSIYIYNHLSCMYLFEYVCLTIVITTWIITFSNGQILFFGCLRSRLSIISKWFISYISRHWMKNQDRPPNSSIWRIKF